jgi:methyl-accepting chemotaxis protein
MVLESTLRFFGMLMPFLMLGWLGAGLVVIGLNRQSVDRDALDLAKVKEFVKDVRGSDYDKKIAIRLELFQWADANATTPVARWIFTAHNSALAGSMPDAAALTDAIWSFERERYHWFRFFARYAILLGLLFTSLGLCLTLSDIGPALTAQGLTEADWLKEVKAAMAMALSGMATAFYSSLFGIVITLILQVANLVTMARAHETHLINLDAFVQGSLIPVFSAIVEKDRNDVIVQAMNRTEDMFAASCRLFEGSREQYDRLFEQTAQMGTDLGDMRGSLAGSLQTFGGQIGSLGERVREFDAVSEKLARSAEGMGQAIEHGLEQIEVTQRKVGEHIQIQQAESQKLVSALEYTVEHLQVQVRSNEAAGERLGVAASEFKQVREALQGQAGELRGLSESQRDLNGALSGLQQVLKYSEEDLHADLETRRNALEAMVGQMGKQVATGIEGPVRSALQHHLDQFAKLHGEQLSAQHEAQASFNRTMDRKWDQLMSVMGAVGDMRA